MDFRFVQKEDSLLDCFPVRANHWSFCGCLVCKWIIIRNFCFVVVQRWRRSPKGTQEYACFIINSHYSRRRDQLLNRHRDPFFEQRRFRWSLSPSRACTHLFSWIYHLRLFDVYFKWSNHYKLTQIYILEFSQYYI